MSFACCRCKCGVSNGTFGLVLDSTVVAGELQACGLRS